VHGADHRQAVMVGDEGLLATRQSTEPADVGVEARAELSGWRLEGDGSSIAAALCGEARSGAPPAQQVAARHAIQADRPADPDPHAVEGLRDTLGVKPGG
jgi:hypothetical protein